MTVFCIIGTYLSTTFVLSVMMKNIFWCLHIASFWLNPSATKAVWKFKQHYWVLVLLHVKMPEFRELSGKMVEEAFHCTDYESEHVVDTVISPPQPHHSICKNHYHHAYSAKDLALNLLLLVKHGIEKNGC